MKWLRQAINEQDYIRNNERFNTTRRINTKLVDDNKLIGLPVIKINNFYYRVLFSRNRIFIHLPFKQAAQAFLVGLQQSLGAKVDKIFMQLLKLRIR